MLNLSKFVEGSDNDNHHSCFFVISPISRVATPFLRLAFGPKQVHEPNPAADGEAVMEEFMPPTPHRPQDPLMLEINLIALAISPHTAQHGLCLTMNCRTGRRSSSSCGNGGRDSQPNQMSTPDHLQR